MFSSISEFYKGKKVFLTGHTGFKGSWMMYWLAHMGATVKGYALAPEFPYELYHQLKGDECCSSVIADIRDKDRLEKELLVFKPDLVFHLAAQPLVRLSYDIPVETFEVNAIGTANVLDAARRLDGPCTLVMITTDKVYENKEWIYPYRENDRLGGLDPYSASKACAEIVIHSYAHAYFNPAQVGNHGKPLASARAGNVIGGGDWAKDRIIPDIVRALKAGRPVPVRNPAAVRPWQHVLEPISGYLKLGMSLTKDPVSFAGAWNFGPVAQDNLTVQEVVEEALRIWGSGSYEVPTLKDQPHEAGLLKLDISKATAMLNWHPAWNASAAISHTLNWYKQLDDTNARMLVQQDIDAYMSVVGS